MNSLAPAIRVCDLVKRYPGRPPVEAVRGLSLEVRRGECFGLLGPNGAGKTTTIEILEGLLPPTSGSVEVLGLRWETDERQLREQIGVSLQETRLSEKLTVGETIRLFRSFYAAGIDPTEALEMVGLAAKTQARVGSISGGERQRLAVATAIVGWPELLFLDEPTTGLDPHSRRQIWDLVERCRACGHTVLLTTHFMDEAERLCDRLAIVDAGQIIAAGTPAELITAFGVADLDDVFLKLAGRRLTDTDWTDKDKHDKHAPHDNQTKATNAMPRERSP
ncbi:MAG: ABC transporter ATP-binding protein [Planctomycetota bacterium]